LASIGEDEGVKGRRSFAEQFVVVEQLAQRS
jgi:hypothetical protein